VYHDDRPHGYGKMTTADGTVLYDGMWQLGEFIGTGSTSAVTDNPAATTTVTPTSTANVGSTAEQ
jgi:hypothetical protein